MGGGIGEPLLIGIGMVSPGGGPAADENPGALIPVGDVTPIGPIELIGLA